MTTPPDPILLDFPDEFTTERLLIRAPRPGDGPTLHAAVKESQAFLRPWMPWAQNLPTPEEYEVIARQGAARFLKREDLWLLLFRRQDGVMVGGSGLHRIDWRVPCFEIGYWVREPMQRQGYISEAVRGITSFAFATLNAERVEIRCDTRNTPSANVAKRCGYTLEGTLRHDARDNDGNLRDTYIFGMTRPEWETLRPEWEQPQS